MEGDYLLDLINVHCSVSSSIYALVNSTGHQSIKYFEKLLETKFANVKLNSLENQHDAQRLLNKLTEQKLTKPIKQIPRSYLFAQSFAYLNPQVVFHSIC